MTHFRVEVVCYGRRNASVGALAAYRAGERLAEVDAAALAAYRSGEAIADAGTGTVHDFTRRSGVRATWLELPPGAPAWAMDRAALWSAADQAEKRRNSVLAREVLVSLPHELTDDGRSHAVDAIARALVERYGFAVDVAIHDPPRTGDERHHHAHLLCTTRQLGPDGFGKKTRVLDAISTRGREVEAIRALAAEAINQQLAREGLDLVDHRSNRRQASAIRAKVAREDRAAVAGMRDKARMVRLQALQAWRLEDLERRLAQDPMVWTRATRIIARDREQREVAAETAARVEAKIDMLGRKLTAREVRSIRQAVQQRRDRHTRNRQEVRFWTRDELTAAKVKARADDVRAMLDKPARIAAIEAEIRKRGHLVQAVAVRLDAGRVHDRDGTRPPATLASVRQLIARAKAAERARAQRNR